MNDGAVEVQHTCIRRLQNILAIFCKLERYLLIHRQALVMQLLGERSMLHSYHGSPPTSRDHAPEIAMANHVITGGGGSKKRKRRRHEGEAVNGGDQSDGLQGEENEGKGLAFNSFHCK